MDFFDSGVAKPEGSQALLRSEAKDPGKNNFRILGARIWVSFVRSGGAKTGAIASSFEDFGDPGAGEDGLKPGWIKCDSTSHLKKRILVPDRGGGEI